MKSGSVNRHKFFYLAVFIALAVPVLFLALLFFSSGQVSMGQGGGEGDQTGGCTYTPDQAAFVNGFRIDISGDGAGSDPDSNWKACTGGALNIEVADSSVGQYKTAVRVQYARNVEIKAADVDHYVTGIEVLDSHDIWIDDSVLAENGTGIVINNSANVTIRHNELSVNETGLTWTAPIRFW
jgi:parallel beta-helix repeat protein